MSHPIEIITVTADQLRQILREELAAALSEQTPAKPQPLGKPMTREEAAAFLGIKPKTLDARAADNRIPYRLNGDGKKEYFESDLYAWRAGELEGGAILGKV